MDIKFDRLHDEEACLGLQLCECLEVWDQRFGSFCMESDYTFYFLNHCVTGRYYLEILIEIQLHLSSFSYHKQILPKKLTGFL